MIANALRGFSLSRRVRIYLLVFHTSILLSSILVSCSNDSPKMVSHINHDVINRLRRASLFSDVFRIVDSIQLEYSTSSEIQSWAAMAVSPGGDIAFADAGRSQVLVFSRDGSFKKAVGRSGRGPGEILSARYVSFSPEGEILVADPGNARVNIYGAKGEFIRGFRPRDGSPICVVSNGKDLFVLVNSYGSGIIQRYSPDGQFRGSFGEAPSFILKRTGVPINGGALAVCGDSIVYYVHPADYGLKMFSSSGKLLKSIDNPTGRYRPPSGPPKAITASSINEWNSSWDPVETIVDVNPGFLILTYSDRSRGVDKRVDKVDIYDDVGNLIVGDIESNFLPCGSDSTGTIYCIRHQPNLSVVGNNPMVFMLRIEPK